MEKVKEKLKCNKKGITLISLVVTIVVLLILAGVSIGMLTGNNGILKQASEAKKQTETASKNEKYDLSKIEDLINESQTGIVVKQVTDINPGVLEGSGTEENPYVVNSIEDLVFFAYDVRQGNTYEGKNVKLGLNLDFNSTKSYIDAFRTDYGKYGYDGELKTLLTTGEGFRPIGITNNISQSSYSFGGIFDGNEKLIINLRINKELEDNVNDLRIGFFGNNYGVIKNLGLISGNIYGALTTTSNNTIMIGGIAGSNHGEIANCFISGTVSTTENNNSNVRIGGISGNSSRSFINNCYNMANINGYGGSLTYVGGISGNASNNTQISNCYNVGVCIINTLDGTTVAIGGIIGYSANSTINNCYNINVLNLHGNSNYLRAGGVVGYSENINMNNCHNKGKIILDEIETNHLHIGMIAGTNYSNGIIKSCSYLKQEEYSSIADNGGTDESILIEKESDIPNILDILGSSFKNGSLGYPVLSWE